MSIREQNTNIEAMLQQARGGIGTPPELTTAKAGKAPRGNNFAVILYEDCAEHMEMLKYLTTRQRYECVWIKHDKDVWTAEDEEVLNGTYSSGDSKKAHYHIMWKVRDSSTASAQQKFFRTWVNHVELISSASSYVAYMLHDTPDSMHKTPYSMEELQGSSRLIKRCLGDEAIIQNKNLVEMANILTEGDGSVISLIGRMSMIPDNEIADYMDTLARFQGLLSEASRQEIARKIRKGK